MTDAQSSPRTELNNRQTLFAQFMATGLSGKQSAINSGYASKNATQTASDLMKNPGIRAEIARIQAKACEKAIFNLETAMAEAKVAQEFAISKGQGMALVNATKLRAELAGLLVHRHEVETHTKLDISGALARLQAQINSTFRNVTPAQIEATPQVVQVEDVGNESVKKINEIF